MKTTEKFFHRKSHLRNLYMTAGIPVVSTFPVHKDYTLNKQTTTTIGNESYTALHFFLEDKTRCV